MQQAYYASKQVLIIEDQAEMRAQLKSMLERLGIEKLHTVTNGEEAIEALRVRPFDIVLSDYELGRGKDGQQVLEEARHAKLLKEASSYILVTAAQTIEMVMGALEYNPDGYITKPVTFDDLKARIERILKMKMIFEEINNALDDGETEEAIKECNTLIKERPKIALPTLRILSRIYLCESRYADAEHALNTALEIRDVAWAKLGLSKVKYHQNQFEAALEILESLSEAKEKYVESQDWLAKIYESQGDLEKAQKTLEKAIAQSPKAILRQSELARISRINEDWAVATQAARKTVSLGRNSCHKKPDHYLQLVEGLKAQLFAGGLRGRRYITTEIVKTLTAIRIEFPEDDNLIIRSYILDSEIQHKLGRAKDAERLALEATTQVQALADRASPDLIMLTAKNLVETCDLKKAVNFIESEVCEKHLNEEQKNELIQLTQTAEEAKISEQIDALNNQGVEYFEKGLMKEAIGMFDKAAQFPSASYSVLLNAVQAQIALLQKVTDDQVANQCANHLTRLSKMQEDDRRYSRYKKLSDMYQDALNNKN